MSMNNTVKQNKNKITIYTNETCPHCKNIKEVLTTSKIEFEEISIGNEAGKWNSIVDFIGMATVPTIYFEGQYLVPGRDFGNAESLVKRIESYIPSHHTVEEIALEKLKTLNHNISLAFNQTNQLLRQIEAKLKIEE